MIDHSVREPLAQIGHSAIPSRIAGSKTSPLLNDKAKALHARWKSSSFRRLVTWKDHLPRGSMRFAANQMMVLTTLFRTVWQDVAGVLSAVELRVV